jgi:hypothetical protein
MYKNYRKRALLPVLGAAAVVMLVMASSASANIVRPAGATPIGASVVIAYRPCVTATPAGEAHNPANLPGAACTPPAQYTPRLTAGDPVVNGSAANFRGNIKLVVVTSPDDVNFPSGAPGGNYVQDVRCTPGYASANPAVCNGANVLLPSAGGGPSPNPDYSGSLNTVAYIRITDQQNSGTNCPAISCPDDATVQDLAFAVAADCANTGSTSIGSTCLPRWASAGALCGCVATGKRSNIEVGVGNSSAGAASSLPTGAIFAMDGGNDGVVPDLVADTDSPAPYTRTGLFLP